MIAKLSSDDVHFWEAISNNSGFSRTGSNGQKETISFRDWEAIGELRAFPKGVVLISAEEVPACLYIVKSGLVAGYEELANGSERIYYLMDKNAMFLEANLMLSRPASVNFRTLEPSELIMVKKDALMRAFQEDPQISCSLFFSVSNKFLVAMDELRGSRSHSAEWMLCHLLLEFAERYGVAYDGKVLISKSLSFQMLADMIGVNRVTAVRAMRSLRDLGLVEWINGFHCIRSPEALKTHQEWLDGT